MAFTEDLSLFFEPTEFADSATLTPAATGVAAPGNVLFDLNGLVADEFDVQSTGPTVVCPANQWPGLREGDHLAIAFAGGTLYYKLRVVTPLADGALVLLTLAQSTVADTTEGTLYLNGDVLLFGASYLGFEPGSAFTPGQVYFNSDALMFGDDNLVLS